jgi:hypothetical protein
MILLKKTKNKRRHRKRMLLKRVLKQQDHEKELINQKERNLLRTEIIPDLKEIIAHQFNKDQKMMEED